VEHGKEEQVPKQEVLAPPTQLVSSFTAPSSRYLTVDLIPLDRQALTHHSNCVLRRAISQRYVMQSNLPVSSGSNIPVTTPSTFIPPAPLSQQSADLQRPNRPPMLPAAPTSQCHSVSSLAVPSLPPPPPSTTRSPLESIINEAVAGQKQPQKWGPFLSSSPVKGGLLDRIVFVHEYCVRPFDCLPRHHALKGHLKMSQYCPPCTPPPLSTCAGPPKHCLLKTSHRVLCRTG
jgi:hypothetical protein